MNANIRTIQPIDNPRVAEIIRTVMPEFGASGQGFAIHNAEVDTMFEAYSRPGCAYFVVELDGRVGGGAGVAPLEGGPTDTCELKKMYFLEELRGKGADGKHRPLRLRYLVSAGALVPVLVEDLAHESL